MLFDLHIWLKSENKIKISKKSIKSDKKSLIFFDFIFFTNIIVVENVLNFYHYKIMNSKKFIVRFALAFLVISWIMISLPSDAINLVLNLEIYNEEGDNNPKVLNYNNIRAIHFAENKNDFWGLFIFNSMNEWNESGNEWNNGEPEEPENQEEETFDYEIKYGNDQTIQCKERKGWFYYNAERWERLRPLDEDTMKKWSIDGLTTSWWIFTNCPPNVEEYKKQMKCCEWWTQDPTDDCMYQNRESGTAADCYKEVREKYTDLFSYYGVVTHEYSWQHFLLAVWVQYATWTPWVEVKWDLWKTFQAHPKATWWSKLPFWLIYDANWWVGFAWCEVKKFEGINQLIVSGVNETWIMNFFEMTKWTEEDQPYLNYIKDDPNDQAYFNCKDIWKDMTTALWILIEWLIWLWNSSTEYSIWESNLAKTQYFASANINNATLINHARQKAEQLCRWKWRKENDSDNPRINSGINCLLWEGQTIKLSATDRNKTIIVKNWNVMINPFLKSEDDSNYYDIFVDSWNLIINEANNEYPDNPDDYDFLISKNGFVNKEKGIDGFFNEVDSILNTIAAGERMLSQDSFDSLTDVWVASILKWNFIVNWNIKGVKEWGKLDRKYFIYWKLTSLDSNEDLKETFQWRCLEWPATYWIYCHSPQSSSQNAHPYKYVPLAIIDQNYDSPLIK